MISPARNLHGWFSIISRSVPRFFPLKPPFRWDFPTEHPGCPSRRKTIWSPPSWTGCFNENHGIFIKSRSAPRIPREGGTHGGFQIVFHGFEMVHEKHPTVKYPWVSYDSSFEVHIGFFGGPGPQLRLQNKMRQELKSYFKPPRAWRLHEWYGALEAKSRLSHVEYVGLMAGLIQICCEQNELRMFFTFFMSASWVCLKIGYPKIPFVSHLCAGGHTPSGT